MAESSDQVIRPRTGITFDWTVTRIVTVRYGIVTFQSYPQAGSKMAERGDIGVTCVVTSEAFRSDIHVT